MTRIRLEGSLAIVSFGSLGVLRAKVPIGHPLRLLTGAGFFLLLLVPIPSLIGDEQRTWTSKNGQFTVTAALIDVENGNADLKTSSGAVLTVPLSKLSDADREFISQYLRSKEAADGTFDDFVWRVDQVPRLGGYILHTFYVTGATVCKVADYRHAKGGLDDGIPVDFKYYRRNGNRLVPLRGKTHDRGTLVIGRDTIEYWSAAVIVDGKVLQESMMSHAYKKTDLPKPPRPKDAK